VLLDQLVLLESVAEMELLVVVVSLESEVCQVTRVIKVSLVILGSLVPQDSLDNAV
jgi:hypothetical protein